MTLTLPDGERFATGSVTYQYRPATTHETTPRIILAVEIDGILTEAVVDTGASTCSVIRILPDACRWRPPRR